MGFWEIILIAIGVSMDAFAVSVGKGLSLPKVHARHALSVALWFGGFQGLMPVLGYFLGRSFASYVESVDHWIAFGLLLLIGANMIREAVNECTVRTQESPASPERMSETGPAKGVGSAVGAEFRFKTMLALAVATSIDALACGVSFAFLKCNIWLCALIIGVTTATFSIIGLYAGHTVGCRFRHGAGIAGGVILLLIGLKILIEHLQ